VNKLLFILLLFQASLTAMDWEDNWENNTDQEQLPEAVPILPNQDPYKKIQATTLAKKQNSKTSDFSQQKKTLKIIVYKKAWREYQENLRQQKKKATRQKSRFFETDSEEEEEETGEEDAKYELLKPRIDAYAKKQGYEIINNLSDADNEMLKKRLEKAKAKQERLIEEKMARKRQLIEEKKARKKRLIEKEETKQRRLKSIRDELTNPETTIHSDTDSNEEYEDSSSDDGE